MEALRFCSSNSNKCLTPAETSLLPKDKDRDSTSGTISSPSTIGMLLCLARHTHPDIAFAVHQYAHYMFEPAMRQH